MPVSKVKTPSSSKSDVDRQTDYCNPLAHACWGLKIVSLVSCHTQNCLNPAVIGKGSTSTNNPPKCNAYYTGQRDIRRVISRVGTCIWRVKILTTSGMTQSQSVINCLLHPYMLNWTLNELLLSHLNQSLSLTKSSKPRHLAKFNI